MRFDQRHQAEKAIKELNGTIPDGATEPITVKFASSPTSHKNLANVTVPMSQILAPVGARRIMGGPVHPSLTRPVRFLNLLITVLCNNQITLNLFAMQSLLGVYVKLLKFLKRYIKYSVF